MNVFKHLISVSPAVNLRPVPPMLGRWQVLDPLLQYIVDDRLLIISVGQITAQSADVDRGLEAFRVFVFSDD